LYSYAEKVCKAFLVKAALARDRSHLPPEPEERMHRKTKYLGFLSRIRYFI
jgi:hypothetical protein